MAHIFHAALVLCLVRTTTGNMPFSLDRVTDQYTYSSNLPLLKVFRSSLPKPLFNLLAPEAKAISAYVAKRDADHLKHGKKATFWMPASRIKHLNSLGKKNGKRPSPRSAIEAAISLFFQIAFPNSTHIPGGFAGAEWWVQRVRADEHTKQSSIGFHFDKDEGVASERGYMKMPVFSTVTYLTDDGAPTMVINQTTNRGGNMNIPEHPTAINLVFPKRGRHLIFRGNLAHGVPGQLAPLAEGGAAHRTTFLINWWNQKPIEPYCLHTSRSLWNKDAFVSTQHQAKLKSVFQALQKGRLVHLPKRSRPSPLVASTGDCTSKRVPTVSKHSRVLNVRLRISGMGSAVFYC